MVLGCYIKSSPSDLTGRRGVNNPNKSEVAFMYSDKQARAYCCEPVEKIQGFKEASVSSEKYHIHHKFEEMGLSRQDLMGMGLLYNRPACELMFIKGKEHNRIHSKIIPTDSLVNGQFKEGSVPEFTEEHRRHISEAKKGVKQTPEHTLHVKEACAPIRATQEFRDKLHTAQERIWSPKKCDEQARIIKNLWETNNEYREAMTKKASISIHKDLDAYKQYKASGGELSWKPFRSWLAQQRKAK